MSEYPIHILLVEDEPAHAGLVRRAFDSQRAKYDLAVATTVARARAALEHGTFDVVVSDLLLPDGRGIDLIPDLSETASCPMILLTSFGNEQVAVEAMKAGAIDYVVKSETALTDMPHVVDRALRSWRLLRERQKAEQALHDSETMYRSLVENVPQYIFRKDLEGRITFCNSRMAHLLELPVSEIIGKTDADLYPDELARKYQADDQQALQTGEVFETIEKHYPVEKEPMWVQVVKAPIYGSSNRIVGLQGIFWDITERVQMEEQLREREAQLAHVSRLSTMGEMVGGIAHEIAQPLSAIANFAAACDVILEKVDHEQTTQLLEWTRAIGAQVMRAGEIIKRLRNFVKQSQPQRNAYDLKQLIQESVALVACEARRRSITVAVHLPECDRLVLVDHIQIQQVLVNLLCNAFHVSDGLEPARRHVSVNVSGCPDAVQVAVSDAGTGLPDVETSRLFDAFFSTKPNGMGLGLAISRTIVEAHGGRLWAANNAGYGATFCLRLPLAETDTCGERTAA